MATTEMNCLASGGGLKSFYKEYTNPGGPITESIDFEPTVVIYCRCNNNSRTFVIRVDMDNSTTNADFWYDGTYQSVSISSVYEYSNGSITLKDLNANDTTVYVFAQE